MRIAAGILIIRDGLVLAFARADGRGFGLPCGRVEPCEAPKEAAVREALEEVGCVVVAEGEPYVGWCTESMVFTWRGTLVDESCESTTPDEGYKVWVPPADVCRGPLGAYNKAAILALYPSLTGTVSLS